MEQKISMKKEFLIYLTILIILFGTFIIFEISSEANNKLIEKYLIDGNVKELKKSIDHYTHYIENVIKFRRIAFNSDISKLLVEKRLLSPNVALRIAIKENRQDIINFLLLNTDLNMSEAAFDAAKTGSLELLKFIQNKGPIDIKMTLKGAIEGGHINIINKLLKSEGF